ncbi:MAG: Lsr2 family protein [Pseudonocardia sp.]|nr:Lsr2 family protein [Pseudonocardia sp.]
MAQIQTIRLVDDLTGVQAEETVSFTLDGTQFEIDLSAGNAGQLRETLAPFLAAGRRASPSTGRSGTDRGPHSSNSTEDRAHNQAVRAWARENGYIVSERGRIPREVLSAYDTARAGSTRSTPSTVQFSG